MAFRPHVVHANTLHTLPEATVARSLGLPVVMHVHEIPPPGVKLSVTLRWAARVADVLEAVSGAVADMLEPYARDRPVVTVHNGVDVTLPPVGERAGAVTVGTVGSVSVRKGTDIFLRAAEIVGGIRPDLRFEHAGPLGVDADESFAAGMHDLARRIGVEMHGPTPAADLLPSWDIFAFPSRQDPFPLATLEAMAAGLPVVASSVGGIPEQIEHMTTGILVPAEDPEVLAGWVVKLYDNPQLRTAIGSTAQQQVAQRFSLTKQVEAIHTAYTAALTMRYAPRGVRGRTRIAL
jgi:glycosyltransferase involved in cell wall biosynthesis